MSIWGKEGGRDGGPGLGRNRKAAGETQVRNEGEEKAKEGTKFPVGFKLRQQEPGPPAQTVSLTRQGTRL